MICSELCFRKIFLAAVSSERIRGRQAKHEEKSEDSWGSLDRRQDEPEARWWHRNWKERDMEDSEEGNPN